MDSLGIWIEDKCICIKLLVKLLNHKNSKGNMIMKYDKMIKQINQDQNYIKSRPKPHKIKYLLKQNFLLNQLIHLKWACLWALQWLYSYWLSLLTIDIDYSYWLFTLIIHTDNSVW